MFGKEHNIKCIFTIKSSYEAKFNWELSVNWDPIDWLFLGCFTCSNSVYLIIIRYCY